jgi:hypothetical protein
MNNLIKSMMVIAMLTCTAAYADEGMENLKFFKAGGMQHGKWQMELLEGGDPQMQQGMQKMGKMSICMDMAKQMAKDYRHDNAQTNSCTHKVIKDSADSAEVVVTCESGSHIHSLITRDGDKSYIVDANITSKEGKGHHMKARYTYLGECTGEGVVQFDKDSKACQMMRKNTNGTDMTAMCAKLPEKMREQCVTNMKQAQASCQ